MRRYLLLPVSLLLILVITLSACQSGGTIAPTSLPQATPSVTTPPTITSPATWKLVAIFPGVVTDADYNTLGYIAINEVQRELDISSAYVENVQTYNLDAIIRGYIADGYNIIWTHGSQFVNDTVDLARHFPDIFFIAEGDELVADPPANLWFIERNFQVGFYLIGATAALSTRTGKIGYLGGERLAFSYAEVHAIQQAIRDLGLEGQVELVTIWVGDFNDPIKADESAKELISQNVDFIMGSLNLGMFGAFEAVKADQDQKIMITAKYIDKSGFAPENYVTSLLYDFNTPLKDIVQRIMAGEIGGYYPLGFTSGNSLQFPFKNVNPSIELQVKTLLDQIIDGTIQVIKDTSLVQ